MRQLSCRKLLGDRAIKVNDRNAVWYANHAALPKRLRKSSNIKGKKNVASYMPQAWHNNMYHDAYMFASTWAVCICTVRVG